MRAMNLYDLMPLPEFVCPHCGSPNIQMQVWQMVNTGEVVDDCGGYHWCNDCELEEGDGEFKYLATPTGLTADGGLTWRDF